jgi:hypothetical protein
MFSGALIMESVRVGTHLRDLKSVGVPKAQLDPAPTCTESWRLRGERSRLGPQRAW